MATGLSLGNGNGDWNSDKNDNRLNTKFNIQVQYTGQDEIKFSEILKETFNCLGPLSKLCVKTIEAIKKSQIGIYFHKGKNPRVKPLTPDQNKVMEDCYKVCIDYQRMDLGRDSFLNYLCTGKVDAVTKKQLRKEATKLRRHNKKGRQESEEDHVEVFLEWRKKAQKMFDIYELLTRADMALRDIIRAVDPHKKTNLTQLLKSDKVDKILAGVKNLTKDLKRNDFQDLCSCGYFRAFLAEKLEDAQLASSSSHGMKCRCSRCGLDISEVNALVATAQSKSDGEKANQKAISDCKSKGDKDEDGLVECSFVLRMEQESVETAVLDVIRTADTIEWETEGDSGTLTVCRTAGKPTNHPRFTKAVQDLFAKAGSDGITGLRALEDLIGSNLTSLGAKPYSKKGKKKYRKDVRFSVSRETANAIRKQLIVEQGKRTAQSTTNSRARTLGLEDSLKLDLVSEAATAPRRTQYETDSDGEDEDGEGLEVVFVDDKSTQTDFHISDSEIEILDEAVVPLCVRSSEIVVKERKVPIWYDLGF